MAAQSVPVTLVLEGTAAKNVVCCHDHVRSSADPQHVEPFTFMEPLSPFTLLRLR